MTQVANDFLNSFSPQVQQNIAIFRRVLWEHDSDVFIFMARKAACFYDCLKELGLCSVNGIALNDRILDMDLSFLKDKKVTLVDDCIFSGTTLRDARNLIVKAGCKSYDTISLAINSDWINSDILPGGSNESFFNMINPILTDDTSCVQQCIDIIRAISIVPRPYDVDFPHSKAMKIKSNSIDNLLNCPGWRKFNISSLYQREHDVTVYSLLPDNIVREKFCSQWGLDYNNTSIIKIRVYIKKLSDETSTLRFVPIVMLPAINFFDIQKSLLGALSKEELADAGFKGNLSIHDSPIKDSHDIVIPTAQYRLLHFLISHSLLDDFCANAISSFPNDYSLELRTDQMKMSFGDKIEKLYSVLWQKRGSIKIPETINKDAAIFSAEFDYMPRTVNDDMSFISEFLSPFVWLYQEKEIPTRQFIKTHGINANICDSNCDTKRLIKGFSPNFLLNRIQSQRIDAKLTSSILLDIYVDLGIIVPTVMAHDNYCIRVFRHGEDALLREASERLLLKTLEGYYEATGQAGMGEYELTKLITIAIQFSIRESLIESILLVDNIPQNCNIISIKGYLYGPVPTVIRPWKTNCVNVGSPFMSPERNEYDTPRHNSIIRYWQKKGCIQYDFLKKKFIMGDLPNVAPNKSHEAKLKRLGRTIGIAVKEKQLNIYRDFITLTMTDSYISLLLLLGAEVNIFYGRWNSANSLIREFVNLKDYSSARKKLRDSIPFKALNSGIMKYSKWENDDFRKIIQRIEVFFSTYHDERVLEDWNEIWPRIQRHYGNQSSYIVDAILGNVMTLHILRILTGLLDYWLAQKIGDAKECMNVKEEIVASHNVIVRLAKHNVNNQFFAIVHDKISDNLNNLENIGSFVKDNIKKILVEDLPQRISHSEEIIKNNGDLGQRISFPYSVYFRIDKTYTEIIDDQIQTGIKKFLGSKNHILYHDIFENGDIIIHTTGGINSSATIEFAVDICAFFFRNNIIVDCIVIGQLKNECCASKFEHSLHIDVQVINSLMEEIRQDFFQKEKNNSIIVCTAISDDYVSELSKIYPNAQIVNALNRTIYQYHWAEQSYDFDVQVIKTSDCESIMDMEMKKKNKILLCTATDVEDRAIVAYARRHNLTQQVETNSNIAYVNLGLINNCNIFWIRSSSGSLGTAGSMLTTTNAIVEIDPDFVISCGIAFGINKDKQEILDILVSESILNYEKGKTTNNDFLHRGEHLPATPILLQIVRIAQQSYDKRVTIGTMLSGEKIVNSPVFKDALKLVSSEAIGGEMEGNGIAGAAYNHQKPWIVVKSICDWAEEKTDHYQEQAALDSVGFVFHILSLL